MYGLWFIGAGQAQELNRIRTERLQAQTQEQQKETEEKETEVKQEDKKAAEVLKAREESFEHAEIIFVSPLTRALQTCLLGRYSMFHLSLSLSLSLYFYFALARLFFYILF